MAGGTFREIVECQHTVYRWLHMAEGQPFVRTMETWLEQEMMQLKSSRDPVDINRAQGRVEVLDKILSWRKTL